MQGALSGLERLLLLVHLLVDLPPLFLGRILQLTREGIVLGNHTITLLDRLLDQLLQVNRQVLQMTQQANAARQNELNQWRNSHPELVQSCRSALETLSSVQTDFLQKLADEVEAGRDDLLESEYMFADFLDRFGPRMAHLNGMLQLLNHLVG